MPEYRKSILVDEAPIVVATDYSYDLPVDPLSHLVITLNFLNSMAMTKATVANILSCLPKISIVFRGAHIYDLSGADLFVASTILLGRQTHQENVVDTLNAIRSFSLILPFGRKLYDPKECFMATKRGELSLKISTAPSFPNIASARLLVQTVELPGAAPANYLKLYTITRPVVATGEADIDLPRGNILLGNLLFSSVIPTGTVDTCTADRVSLLLSNERKYYTEARWESLKGELVELLPPVDAFAEKFHRENVAPVYTQNADTITEEQDMSDIARYAFMNYGLGPVAGYEIDTKPLSEIKIRVTSTATGLLRVCPIEIVKAA
ncbi:MAG: hypothetical protein DDT22_00900 [candidate division WS2 bacterium]|nr:hypothetical protein [Candidatus Lithacetigena glycinireducens]